MGFALAKRLLIERLTNHKFFIYRERSDIMDKNKLYTREVDVKFVLDKINQCKRRNYHTEFSLDADDNTSHVFIKDRWYFKYCVIDGDVNIVSVHKEDQYV